MGLTFYWVLFLQRSNLRFSNQNEKDGFLDTPFAIFKEKKFSALKNLKVKNAIVRKRFFKQVLGFHSLFKILRHNAKL